MDSGNTDDAGYDGAHLEGGSGDAATDARPAGDSGGGHDSAPPGGDASPGDATSAETGVDDAAGNDGPGSDATEMDAADANMPLDASDAGPPPMDAAQDAPQAGPIAVVQSNQATSAATAATALGVTFLQSQQAGDLIVLAIGWTDDTSTVTSVTDSKNNNYRPAIGPTRQSPDLTQYIYYASGIAAAAPSGNTVTVKFSGGVHSPDLRAAEYSGLGTNAALDRSAGANGKSMTASSGAVTTTTGRELLFGAGMCTDIFGAPGGGFMLRILTANGNIAEDQIVSATGSYTAGAALSSATVGWVMQVATFR